MTLGLAFVFWQLPTPFPAFAGFYCVIIGLPLAGGALYQARKLQDGAGMALSAVGLNLLALVVVVHSMWKLVMDFGMTVTGHSLGDLALVITLLVGTTLSVAALKRCSGVDSESMCKYWSVASMVLTLCFPIWTVSDSGLLIFGIALLVFAVSLYRAGKLDDRLDLAFVGLVANLVAVCTVVPLVWVVQLALGRDFGWFVVVNSFFVAMFWLIIFLAVYVVTKPRRVDVS